MLADWKAFLISQGAHIEEELVRDFGSPDREAESMAERNVVTDLSYLTVIRISGADAAAFLNGQFSCDVGRLIDGGVKLCSWCNPKGQVIADFIIVRHGEEFFLLLPREIKDSFLQRLRKFVLRAKITLEDGSDTLACMGYKQRDGDQISGSEIAARLATREQAFQYHGLVMLHVPVNWNRVIIFGPAAMLAAAWSELVQTYSRSGSFCWHWFDIQDGLPWVLNATTETLLPQFLNLDCLQGVSFTKGCFPGQEVIARLQHRGKIKQRLFLAHLDAETTISPGDKIYSDEKERSAGVVVNTVNHPAVGQSALVVLDSDYGNPEHLRLKNNSVRFINISTPQYLNTDQE